jgi:predicted GIY-YIG superfamily endonuclease
VGLQYAEYLPSQGAALVREAHLKTWPRQKKAELIAGTLGGAKPGACRGARRRRQ